MCVAMAVMLLFTMAACNANGQRDNSDVISNPYASTSTSHDKKVDYKKESDTRLPEVQTEAQSTESNLEGEQGEASEMKMKIQVGATAFTATLRTNSTVAALKKLLADGPLTLNMSDYAGMEKCADLGVALPQNNERMNTQAGDIILYQGRTFVIYYDTNSWSLTPIGKIDNVDAESLAAVLGDGDVTVILSIE